MVILGGLEFVIGGYLIHRHHKHKHEKKKQEVEHGRRAVEQFRRQQSCPSPSTPTPWTAEPQSASPYGGYRSRRTDCYGSHTRGQTYPGLQLPPDASSLHPAHSTDFLPSPHSPSPMSLQHLQPLPTVRRRPVPQPQLQTQHSFQTGIPPLRRHDSFSSLSDIPVANGSLEAPEQPSHLQVPSTYPYYNSGFSASMPSFGPSSGATSPHSPYSPYTPTSAILPGSYSAGDNLEIYVRGDLSVDGRRPEEVGEDGEDDPPPPYQP